MPNLPGAWLNGQKVSGIVDGTIVQAGTIIGYGTQGEILVYTGPPATGNLIGSWSGAAGNDNEGNAYPLGLGLQGSGDVLTVMGTSGQSAVIEINGSGVPEIQLSTGAAEEGTAANVEAFITNPGASEAMTLFIYGPKGTTHDDYTGIFLNSATKDGSFNAGANLVWADTSGNPHLLLGWGSGGITVGSLIPGDTNTYQTERLTQGMTGNNPVTINTTNYSQQILQTAALGVGTYHLHGQICVSPNQAAGVPSFELGGGPTAAGMRLSWMEYTYATPFIPDNGGQMTAFAQAFTGTTFGANDRLYAFDGTMVVTVAGALGMFAATSNASDTYVVRGYGSYWELNPIGA